MGEEADVNIYLNETPTIFLWQQPTTAANFTGPEAEAVQAENKKYQEYCAAVATSENFTQRACLTFHLFTKNKEAQTDPMPRVDEQLQLNLHDLVSAPEQHVEQEVTPYRLLHDSCHPLAFLPQARHPFGWDDVKY